MEGDFMISSYSLDIGLYSPGAGKVGVREFFVAIQAMCIRNWLT
jgi:hypothetical protein